MHKIYQIVVRHSVLIQLQKRNTSKVVNTSRVSGRIRAQYHNASSWRAIRCALNEATAIPWALSSSRDTRTLNKIPPRPGTRTVPYTIVTRVSRRMKASCTIRQETRLKHVLGNVRPLDRIVRSKWYFTKKEITRPHNEDVLICTQTSTRIQKQDTYTLACTPIHALWKYFGSCKEFETLLCTDNTHVY